MALNVLSPRGVHAAKVGEGAKAAKFHDGGGLYLIVTTAGANWLLRYTSPAGARREMGLGAVNRTSLAAAGGSLKLARELAAKAREQLAVGVDPIQAREQARAEAQEVAAQAAAEAQAKADTLARVARQYHADVVEPQRTAKHGAQWIASLEQHVPAAIWHAPIASVTAPALLLALAPVRQAVPETCARVRQRLETVFDHAEFHGLCNGNPARAIRRKLAERPAGKAAGSFAALPYAEVPGFMQRLQQQPGTAARALEFALLTAARTAEVLGMTWDEVEGDVWTIPGPRMKGGEEHTVHLSSAALAVLEQVRGLSEIWVFPSPMDTEREMSNMAMLVLLRRMGEADRTTVHGLCRASFSTWANETAAARPDVVEACLAHKEADKIRASYNRAKFADERRALLQAWADYVHQHLECAPNGDRPTEGAGPSR